MLVPGLSSVGYKIVLVLHIVFVVVAFGGLFATPMLARAGRTAGSGAAIAGGMVEYLKRIAIPCLLLAGIFGIGLVSMSKPDVPGATAMWKFDQGWVMAAVVLWLVQVGIFLALLLPAERKLAAGDETAAKRVPMFTGILHLLLLVLLYLMVFKPGI